MQGLWRAGLAGLQGGKLLGEFGAIHGRRIGQQARLAAKRHQGDGVLRGTVFQQRHGSRPGALEAPGAPFHRPHAGRDIQQDDLLFGACQRQVQRHMRLGQRQAEQGRRQQVQQQDQGQRQAPDARPTDGLLQERPQLQVRDHIAPLAFAQQVQGQDHGQAQQAEQPQGEGQAHWRLTTWAWISWPNISVSSDPLVGSRLYRAWLSRQLCESASSQACRRSW